MSLYLTKEDLERLGVEDILESSILSLENCLKKPDDYYSLEACVDEIMNELTNINFEKE